METYHHSDFRWNPSCGGERDPPDSIIFLKIEALILQSHCYPIDSVEKEGETVSPFPDSSEGIHVSK